MKLLGGLIRFPWFLRISAIAVKGESVEILL